MAYSFKNVHIDLPEDVLYFDWASASPICSSARNAISSYENAMMSTWDMPDFVRNRTEALIDVRLKVGELLGVTEPRQIVLTRSATEAINLIANGLDWNEPGEIVISDLEHPSNEIPWRKLAASRNQMVRVLASDEFGIVDLELLPGLLTKQTKIVALTHVSYLHGTIQPIAEAVKIVRKMSSALVAIDGAQAVGRIPVNMPNLGCDVYIGSGRKALLAPLGCAFMYVGERALGEIQPMLVSTRNAYLDQKSVVQLRGMPELLEGNLPDMACLFGLAASVDDFLTSDLNAIHEATTIVSKYLINRARGTNVLRLPVQYDSKLNSGIHSFLLQSTSISAKQLESRLRFRKAVVAAGQWLRLSVHAINTQDQVDRLITLIMQELPG